MQSRSLAASVLCLIAACAASNAAIPRTISFQGVLTNAGRVPLPDGTYSSVTFRLYDHLTGPTQLWLESKSVTVAGGHGLFVTALGGGTAFPPTLAFDQPYWLGVQVGSDAEMSPRLPLQSVPYALNIPAATMTLPFTGTASVASPSAALSVTNSGTGRAVSAVSSGTGVGGAALYAASTANGIGLVVDTTSTDTNVALFQGGTGDLIKGITNSGSTVRFNIDHLGLINTIGGVSATVANNYGVTGHATGAGFAGVYGQGDQNGVYGQTSTGAATGVLGRNESTGWGVFGYSVGGFAGVFGSSANNGVYGQTASADANSAGVYGRNDGAGSGVFGYSPGTGFAGVYGSGAVNGVFGHTGNGAASGVYGDNTGGGAGVAGYSPAGAGVQGVSGSNDGLHAHSDTGYGLYAESGTGTAAYFKGGAGTNGFARALEIHNYNNGAFSSGLYVSVDGPEPPTGRVYAATFHGTVVVDYDFFVTGNKYFRIDDPLDPANKSLTHACIESNEVKNQYDGTVTTDANGDATITLPAYFEALNKDFRYQLTCIGQFAQAIVASKVKDNKFTIKTDKPSVEVDWQVTGLRNDAYEKAHPMKVEQDKVGPEKGRYYAPELFGQPKTMQVGYRPDPGAR